MHDILKAAEPEVSDLYPTRTSKEEWRERPDPIVWGEWHENAPLTREQTQSFEDDGYLVLHDIFDTAEVEALQAESTRLRTRQVDPADETIVAEPGSNEVRTIFQLDQQSALFDKLARDARIAEKVRFLLNDEVYLHQSRLNYKPGFTGKEFYWHSDFETWHAEDGMPQMRAISASILLTDNNALNGPLMLIPGSHRTFIACAGETPDANYTTSLKKQEIGVPSPDSLTEMARKFGVDFATGKAGSVILFDCNTVHGSNGNITPFPRSNSFFVYNAWSNRMVAPFAARAPRPHFLSTQSPEAPLKVANGRIE